MITNNRFIANNYLVIHDKADFMGIPKEIPPVLKTGVDVSRGASFAVADTSILGNSETSVRNPSFIFFSYF